MSDATVTVTDLMPLPFGRAVPAALSFDSLNLEEMVLSGLKPSSAKGYRQELALFAKHAGFASVEQAISGLLQIGQTNANAVIASWQSEQSKAGISPATIRRRVAALMRVFRRGRLFGLTEATPEAELPKAQCFRDTAGPGDHGWQKMLALAVDDASQTEAAGNKDATTAIRDLALILLMYDRGLRRGQAVDLSYPEDVDLDGRAVRIRGKGRDAREWVTVSERAASAVSDWTMVRGEWAGPLFVRTDPAAIAAMDGVNGPLDGPLFDLPEPPQPMPRPGRLTGDSVNRMVRALAKRAGLKRIVRAHGLRHAAITKCLDNGRGYREVMAFSRHLDPKIIALYDDNRKDLGGELSRQVAGEKRRKSKSK
jgi:integrase/recombinase XerC